MLQRRSNTCKLETVTICHLRITGVLSSSAFVRTQARKQGLCARTHNALNLQLLARKTQPDLPFASVLCDFFICVLFSSFCWCFSASVADLFPCPPSTVIQHSTLFRLLCCSPSFHSLSRLVPPCLWRRYQCCQCSCSLPSPCYYSPPSHMIEISISLPLHLSLSLPPDFLLSLSGSRDGVEYQYSHPLFLFTSRWHFLPDRPLSCTPSCSPPLSRAPHPPSSCLSLSSVEKWNPEASEWCLWHSLRSPLSASVPSILTWNTGHSKHALFPAHPTAHRVTVTNTTHMMLTIGY